MTEKLKLLNLIDRLTNANICCHDCGLRYGKYSVGCSSTWQAVCPVCDKTGGCTEVRDFGYLAKGIGEARANLAAIEAAEKGATVRPFSELTKDFTPERKARIKEQSKALADHLLSVGPIMQDPELEDELTASYERGELTLKLTEEEVGFLNECLDTIQAHHPSLQFGGEDGPVDVCLFESIEEKITELYADYCIEYELSPALAAYNKKYGTWGTGDDEARWEGFRDAYNLLSEGAQ